MTCERCGANTLPDTDLCEECSDEPPRRIRVAVGLMAVYWGFFVLFAYGITSITPSGPLTRLPIFFAITSTYLLWGLWNRKSRAWGVAIIVWTLFLVGWPLAVYASPHLPRRYAFWILPVPAFVLFVYRQHEVYLWFPDN